jgi:hypothetical protein
MGFAATAYNAFAAQLVRRPYAHFYWDFINADPQLDAQSADIYAWANAHLPADTIIQHNPASADRVVDFGLYGQFRVDVADQFGMLFGADPRAVGERVSAWGAIFAARAPIPARAGLYLLVTDQDPLFRTMMASRCVVRMPRACLYQAQPK